MPIRWSHIILWRLNLHACFSGQLSTISNRLIHNPITDGRRSSTDRGGGATGQKHWPVSAPVKRTGRPRRWPKRGVWRISGTISPPPCSFACRSTTMTVHPSSLRIRRQLHCSSSTSNCMETGLRTPGCLFTSQCTLPAATLRLPSCSNLNPRVQSSPRHYRDMSDSLLDISTKPCCHCNMQPQTL